MALFKKTDTIILETGYGNSLLNSPSMDRFKDIFECERVIMPVLIPIVSLVPNTASEAWLMLIKYLLNK